MAWPDWPRPLILGQIFVTGYGHANPATDGVYRAQCVDAWTPWQIFPVLPGRYCAPATHTDTHTHFTYSLQQHNEKQSEAKTMICTTIDNILSYCQVLQLSSTLSAIRSLSIRFNGHFPGGARLADTRMSPLWILLELWVKDGANLFETTRSGG